MGEYISPDGLKALDSYAYKSGTYSLLDNILNPFWVWCASLLPLWVAPNLVTLTGVSTLSLIFLTTVWFDPQLNGAAPSWVYFLNSFCVWLYQTLDAVDGKQARRTGTSSPLGQLFDHGCDALGTVFLSVGMAGATCQGPGVLALTILVVVQGAFFFAQWEEYHVHTMRTQFANFGVTEGQYLESIIMLSTGIFGTNHWFFDIAEFLPSSVVVPLTSALGIPPVLQLRHFLMGLAALFPFMMATASFLGVLSRTKSISDTFSAVKQLVPLLVLDASLYVIVHSEGYIPLNSKHPVILMFVFGVLFTHLTNRIIIANVCRVPYDTVHTIMYPLPFVLYVLATSTNTNVLYATLGLYGLLVVVQYIHYVVVVNRQICEYLGINTFRIKPNSKVE